MPCSRTEYSPATSILIYKVVYFNLFVTTLPISSFTIPKCVTSTKRGIFLFFGVVSLISYSSFRLFSCNSSFYHPTLAYSLTTPFCILAFIFWINLKFLIPIQHRHHSEHQLYLLILCNDDVGSQFVS